METTAFTRESVPHTEAIRFWTSGKIAESAYNRITELREDGNEEYAKLLLNEWII